MGNNASVCKAFLQHEAIFPEQVRILEVQSILQMPWFTKFPQGKNPQMTDSLPKLWCVCNLG